MRGEFNDGCALVDDTGGHTGAAPTHLHHIFPHKQNNYLRVINPNEINHPRVIYPNETVGAAPVCPPERPRSGVSIPKIYALCAGITMDAPLWGDTGGHTGTAPTYPHHIFPRNPLKRNA